LPPPPPPDIINSPGINYWVACIFENSDQFYFNL
jgi:hypothetical protein